MVVVQNEGWVTEVILFPRKQILIVKEIIHYKSNIFLFISVTDHWNASYSGLYFAYLYWIKDIVQKYPHFVSHSGKQGFLGPVLNLKRRSLSLSLILAGDNKQNRSVWKCFQQTV